MGNGGANYLPTTAITPIIVLRIAILIQQKGVIVTASENILTQIGEFVYTEMSEVKSVTYAKDGQSFVILFDNGKEFVIEIKPK